jgi:hypothetical protein
MVSSKPTPSSSHYHLELHRNPPYPSSYLQQWLLNNKPLQWEVIRKVFSYVDHRKQRLLSSTLTSVRKHREAKSRRSSKASRHSSKASYDQKQGTTMTAKTANATPTKHDCCKTTPFQCTPRSSAAASTHPAGTPSRSLQLQPPSCLLLPRRRRRPKSLLSMTMMMMLMGSVLMEEVKASRKKKRPITIRNPSPTCCSTFRRVLLYFQGIYYKCIKQQTHGRSEKYSCSKKHDFEMIDPLSHLCRYSYPLSGCKEIAACIKGGNFCLSR